MPASLKYFAIRTLNVLVTILIIAMIFSAIFTSISEEKQEQSIQKQVKREVEWQNFDDPDDANEYREKRIQEMREEYNLDEPRVKKIFHNAVDMITLDLGKARRFTSSGGSREISTIITDYLPYTILLFTTAAVIYTLLAISLGLKLAQMSGSKLDVIITTLSATSSSVPIWWAGMIFLIIFSYILGWYPVPDPSFPLVKNVGYLGYLKELMIKLSLPLFTVVLFKFGGRLLISRNIVVKILNEDYIMAARAKGVPEKKIIYGHTLKTAAPPIMTTAIMAILLSLGGALIAEIIFQWPGIGYLLNRALYWRRSFMDKPGVFEDQLVIGISFVLVVISIVGFYLADIIYGLIDPRIEVGSKFRKEVK